MSNTEKLIAVVGAAGQQGGAVVRSLQASGQFRLRALTRTPARHPKLASEIVLADLNRPETLKVAFAGAYGVFLVTNAWEDGADESKQALTAVKAAKDAGVQHLIWSTLPDVEKISGGTIDVPHFTAKAKVERAVRDARFAYHTFVIAPFYYQNLVGVMAPQKQPDGALGWALPIDPDRRAIHMGDITELGRIVAGAFAKPELAGHGEHLPLVGDFLSIQRDRRHPESAGTQRLVQAGSARGFLRLVPGRRAHRADVRLLRSAHVSRRGFARRDRARQQSGRRAADKVCRVGPDQLREPSSCVKSHRSDGRSGLIQSRTRQSLGPRGPAMVNLSKI